MSDRFLAGSNEMMLREAWRLHGTGEYAQAEQLYKLVIQNEPRNFDAWFRLGFLYGEQDQFEGAQKCMAEAVALMPGSADALFLRGSALLKLNRNEEALSCFDSALALNPSVSEMHLNRAVALYRLRRYEEAETVYGRLLSFASDFAYAAGNRLMCRLHNCDWRSLEQDTAAVVAGLNGGKQIITPFDAKALSLIPALDMRCARIWAADQSMPTGPYMGTRHRHDRIRIAYVAAKFGNDPVSILLAGVIEQHDRNRFETIGVSFSGDDGSRMHKRLKPAFDRFVEGPGLSDRDLAMRIKQMEVDIAIDLMGFTEGCRTGIFENRPAPVQVNYLGFPGTMGAGYIDYILADRFTIPDDAGRHYDEKIVRLPDCYMPADRTRAIAEGTPSRSEAGLPQTGFVFASFNNSYKFNPHMFDVWMRLLKAVEGSVLWLPTSNDAALRNLRREAQARGVEASRLIFASFMPKAEDHLARLRLADLFLDTLPFNAHSTASDALWAGLPVLTCMGETFAGRVAASLLHAVGLPELVTQSLADYEALALKLARDPSMLTALKARLAENRLSQPLFDTARFTRNLEAAYTRMWERSQAGQPAASFTVEAPS